MAGKLAFLFPGQGAQAVGMGQELCAKFPIAKQTFEEADDALGESFSRLIREGPKEDLLQTANTQPAILTMSVAAWRVYREEGGPAADYVAGHSLGEYSALVAGGALEFRDAVRAVRARGTFMQEAVPAGEGAMAAVMGLDAEKIGEVLAGISAPEQKSYVAVANYNGPAQTVIAGHSAGVEAAGPALKSAGAKRVLPLPVSAPFHCELMRPVQDRLRDVLAEIQMAPIGTPVVTNVEAAANSDVTQTLDLLVDQVVAPVRFTEMGQYLIQQGVSRFVELGPGKTLINILRRMERDAHFANVEDEASLREALA